MALQTTKIGLLVWLCVQNMSFEDLKKQMYDMFTMTLERIQLLYVNPGKVS